MVKELREGCCSLDVERKRGVMGGEAGEEDRVTPCGTCRPC